MIPETYTVQQTAKMLHCSQRTVYDRIGAGKIKAVKPCGGRWLVLAEPLEKEFGVKAARHPSHRQSDAEAHGAMVRLGLEPQISACRRELEGRT